MAYVRKNREVIFYELHEAVTEQHVLIAITAEYYGCQFQNFDSVWNVLFVTGRVRYLELQ